MAQELEASQGGIYSTLSQELQLPVVRRLMHQMEKAQRLPVLPEGIVKPAITTGIEAIGRGNDQTKLASFLNMLAPLGPKAIERWMNVGDYIDRSGTAIGIDTKGLIKTKEEVDAADKQEQMMAMIAQGMNPMINQAGQLLKEQSAPSEQGTP
jgi:hypothetical protein